MTLMTFLINPLQRLLQNPMAIKMTLLGIICLVLFLFGAILIRKMRQDIVAETAPAPPPQEGSAAFSLAAYNGLIQQLREKEKNLQRLLEKEQQRSTSAEAAGGSFLFPEAAGSNRYKRRD